MFAVIWSPTIRLPASPVPDGDPDGGSSSPDDSCDDRPHSFPWHASRVPDRFDSVLPVALVPLLTSLFPLENVARGLEGSQGVSINVEFVLPSSSRSRSS